MSKPQPAKAVAEVKPTNTSAPDWAMELVADSGAGFEDVQVQDLAMPFFKLLQSLSPETKRSEPAYIDGAQEGMWCDAIAKEVFDEIVFVPCKMVTHYIEWRTRKNGGGMVKNHGTDQALLKTCVVDPETGRNVTREGTEIVPTATWFGLVIEGTRGGETLELSKRAVLTLSGTQQKVSRRWVSDAASIRIKGSDGKQFAPPMFAMTYRLGSAATKNDQGSWFLATVARAGWLLDYPNGRELFAEAREFGKLARELQPTVYEQEPETAPRSESRSRPAPSGDDIYDGPAPPF